LKKNIELEATKIVATIMQMTARNPDAAAAKLVGFLRPRGANS
jgi:hypothetical protein